MARILLVPGRNAVLPDHWQSRWAREHPEYRWVARPEGPGFQLAERVAALRQALAAEPEPAILVAHSGGCITVVCWAQEDSESVRGAILVAPPDLDRRIAPGHSPEDYFEVPRSRLAFPTVVVASRTDPHATFDRAERYAADWGARLVDAGDAGHIQTSSGYGPFPLGERVLADLIDQTSDTGSQ